MRRPVITSLFVAAFLVGPVACTHNDPSPAPNPTRSPATSNPPTSRPPTPQPSSTPTSSEPPSSTPSTTAEPEETT